MAATVNLEDAVQGCLLGTAFGDALGLAYEGMSRKRIARRFKMPLRYHLLPGNRGMVSDDTEHQFFVAQALLKNGLHDAPRATRNLAWRLRWWLAGIPAGIGLATLRSILKLWVGIPPHRSGVFSAGNGPAMRSALPGVIFHDDPNALEAHVTAFTRLTHTDPMALEGALLIARVAAWSVTHETPSAAAITLPEQASPEQALPEQAGESILIRHVRMAMRAVENHESLETFARSIGCEQGISGFMGHTVPAVIHVWLRHGHDVENGFRELIEAGGDTDSTAAIYGSLAGIRMPPDQWPEAWRTGLLEFPRGIRWLETLARKLAGMKANDLPSSTWPSYPIPLIWVRNLLFVLTVLTHGFLRLLPPY